MDAKELPDFVVSTSTIPGVGDAEVTDDERATARIVGHGLFGSLAGHKGFPETSLSDEPAIPAKFGSFRIFEYGMPANQQPYKVDGDRLTQARLSALYTQDRSGQLSGKHSMVVAVSSTISAASSKVTLDDKPMCENERIVLYVLGGGFVMSDSPQSKWMYIRLSQELGMRAFVPRYHVAPQYVYPRPLHDVYTAYQHLVSRGFRPQDILMMGASAGANICLSVLQLLGAGGEPSSVAGCVIFEPCLDLTMSHASWQSNQDVCVLPYVPSTDPGSLSRIYLGPIDDDDDGVEGNADVAEVLRRPLISPMFADVT
ncbi:hypothetical protein GGI00_002171, partial [Coemansia sp. RSA 2681]